MVSRGLVPSRAEAHRLIAERQVTVSGAIAEKASRLVAESEPIELRTTRRFVSRGGEKLDAALESFGVDVAGRCVLDAGASTGGFTDCVLSRGAARVLSVDVGTNQLHERLLGDPRVVSREKTHIRDLGPRDMPFPCSLAVADLSFISLVTVLPWLSPLVSAEPGHGTAEMILLVKPQFEVGRAEASRGRGVITDPALHAASVDAVARAAEALGWSVTGRMESPLRGQDGNTEFLLHLELTRSSGAGEP
jgi:23S rRNA (cytidine1920-2'-O)/16S rRNA (cytidine1409-2'-O)-methyltransferase